MLLLGRRPDSQLVGGQQDARDLRPFVTSLVDALLSSTAHHYIRGPPAFIFAVTRGLMRVKLKEIMLDVTFYPSMPNCIT